MILCKTKPVNTFINPYVSYNNLKCFIGNGGGKIMRKKIIGIFVCIMLVLTAVVIIVPDNLKVEATPGSGGGEGDIGLNFSYIRMITENLSNVIYKYPSGMLQKGRAFGTWGEQYTADQIIQDEMIEIGLYNPGLDPPYLEQIEDIPSGFELSSINLTNKLETLSLGITVHDEVNRTNTTLIDFHIQPMWNWRLWLALAEYLLGPNIDEILEYLDSIFGINTSDYPIYNMIVNESWLTKNVSYENLSLQPRPTNLSWFFDVLFNRTSEIINNESIIDCMSFMNYFLPELQEYHNFTFGELNPSNAAEELSWFEQWKPPTMGDEDFLYIGEDPD